MAKSLLALISYYFANFVVFPEKWQNLGQKLLTSHHNILWSWIFKTLVSRLSENFYYVVIDNYVTDNGDIDNPTIGQITHNLLTEGDQNLDCIY